MARLSALFVILMISSTVLLVHGKNIIETIKSHPALSETKVWAEESGVLKDFDVGSGYAFGLSLSLPSNKAIQELRQKHPTWENKIKGSRENMETLVLFAATDSRIPPEVIKRGDVAGPSSIISLLAYQSSISASGLLCIDDFGRMDSCDKYPKCCAQLDLDNAIHCDDGIIYLIDSLVLPQEIISKM